MEPGSQFNDAVMRGADAKTISTELRRVLTSAENALLASLQEVSLQQIVKKTTRKKA
jgi:DNA-binding IscR family transcriptional regulator